MGELFRSEEMNLLQFFMQKDVAYDAIDELGKLGLVQFRDMNPDMTSFSRPYVNDVKRCDEMERRLRFIVEELRESGLLKEDESLVTKLSVLEHDAPTKRQVDDIEKALIDTERDLRQSKASLDVLTRDLAQLLEYKMVLKESSNLLVSVPMLGSGGHGATGVDFDFLQPPSYQQVVQTANDKSPPSTRPLLTNAHGDALMTGDAETAGTGRRGEGAGSSLYGFIAGAIHADKLSMFERVLWRAMRGNYYLRASKLSFHVVDPESLNDVMKSTFVVFFQGEFSRDKILKICAGYGANVYSCPDTEDERVARLATLEGRVKEVESVYIQSKDARKNKMMGLVRMPTHPGPDGTSGSAVTRWSVQLKKFKYILHTLNLLNFDASRKCLIAEAWVPARSMGDVEAAVRKAGVRSGALVPTTIHRIRTREMPPTYFNTNKFATAFQDIVHAYGIASYREVNPSAFAAVTFPFLFAMMYGDWGHGSFMAAFAFYLIWNEKKLAGSRLNDIMAMLFGGRYMIFMMGLFSIYTGVIYNDIFSNSVDFFGSSWSKPTSGNSTDQVFNGEAYKFGVDPVWAGNERELNYYNSLKMKMSIIVGVTHMLVGLFLSMLNHPYFKQSPTRKRVGFHSFLTSHDLWLDFIPQLLFLGGMFGYMALLIMLKWAQNWDGKIAPNLIGAMINMMLAPSTLADVEVYANQLQVQQVLVVLAVIAVPWMLFVRPIVENNQRKRKQIRTELHGRDEGLHGPECHTITDDPAWPVSQHPMESHAEEDHESFGDIFIHRIIHVIEFVLGCVSHTASYLRLWALSLAHAELSKVFWDMVFGIGLRSGNFLMIFATFFIWALATIGVLLSMEALSAFLHALRLHWVEFQSKFYKGEGRLFVPFSYCALSASA